MSIRFWKAISKASLARFHVHLFNSSYLVIASVISDLAEIDNSISTRRFLKNDGVLCFVSDGSIVLHHDNRTTGCVERTVSPANNKMIVPPKNAI